MRDIPDVTTDDCLAPSRIDRRWRPDRRSGADRRGSGLRLPLSPEPRAYGFRAFTERRAVQDRRVGRCAPGSGPAGGPAGDDRWENSPVIELTADEIAVLLDRDRR